MKRDTTSKAVAPIKPRAMGARIEHLAREIVDIAEGMSGDHDANLRAACAAALCDALYRSRP